MNLYEVQDYLAAEGVGQIGTTLFAHHMPAPVNEGVLVLSQVPQERDQLIDNYYRGEFQVVVRSDDRETGRLRCKQIADILDGQRKVMGNTNFLFIRAMHEPMGYPRSEGNNLEFSVNFQCAYLISS